MRLVFICLGAVGAGINSKPPSKRQHFFLLIVTVRMVLMMDERKLTSLVNDCSDERHTILCSFHDTWVDRLGPTIPPLLLLYSVSLKMDF